VLRIGEDRGAAGERQHADRADDPGSDGACASGQICSELLGWHKGWDPVTVEDMNGDMLTGCIA
jgi:hypothetical protein